MKARIFVHHIVNGLLALMLLALAPLVWAASLDIELTEAEQTWLADHNKIVVGGEMDWLPFSFVDKNTGQYKGIADDYLKIISAELGIEIEVVTGHPWAELLSMQKNKELDAIPAIYLSEHRGEFLDFTSPFAKVTEFIYTRVGTQGVSSIDDLNGKRLAVVEGFTIEKTLRTDYPGIHIVLAPTIQEALKKVILGEAEAFIGDIASTSYNIREFSLTGLQAVAQGPYTEPTVHMGIRKDWPELTGLINKVLAALPKDRHDAIRDRWIPSHEIANSPAQVKALIDLTDEEAVWLEQHPSVRLGVDPAWPPFDFVNEAGEHDGLIADILAILEKKTGIEYRLQEGLSWNDVKARAKARELDIISLASKTPERKKYLKWTDPIITMPMVVAAREDFKSIDSIEGLSGSRVVVAKGYAIVDYLRNYHPNVAFAEVANPLEGLRNVSVGVADAYVGYLGSISYLIRKHGLVNTRVAGLTGFPSKELSIAVRSDWPELLSIVNKGLSETSHEEMSAILNKWIPLLEVPEKGQVAVADVETGVVYKAFLTQEEQEWLKQNRKIRVHNEMDWPPFNFNDNGKPRGYSIDYMNLLAQKVGLEIEYVSGPSWGEFMEMMRRDELDVMLNIVKTPERQKYLLYTPPYVHNPNTILSKKGKPYRSFEELKGKTVSVPKGFFYEEILSSEYPDIKLLPLRNTIESMKAVSFGRADAALGELAVFNYLIDKNLMTDVLVTGEVKIGDHELSLLNIATQMDKPVLASILRKGVAAISEKEKREIGRKWLGDVATMKRETHTPASSDTRIFWFIAAGLIVLVLLIPVLLQRLSGGREMQWFSSATVRRVGAITVALFLVAVLGLALYSLDRIDEQLRKDTGNRLQVMNSAVHHALLGWLEGRRALVLDVASNFEVMVAAEELLKSPHNAEALLSNPATARLRSLMAPRLERMGAKGIFIIAPDRTSIASMRDANVGTTNLIAEQRPELMERVFSGETVFVPPIVSDVPLLDASGRIVMKAPTMFFATPLRDREGNVMAAFTLRFDPTFELTRITSEVRPGESGETYALDLNGRLLTSSRFADDLIALGIESDTLFRVADPGGNVKTGFQPDSPRDQWPLTLMAKGVEGKQAGLNVEGYRDYRGVQVMGAWLWSRELGVGIATELDVEEALAPYQATRDLVLATLGVTILMALALTGLSVWLGDRAKARLEGLVAERTDELRKIALAVEQSPLCVVITDVDGNIEHVNPTFTRVTGYKIEEVIGKNPRLLQSGETPQDLYENLWQTILAGKVWQSELLNRKKSGELYWGAISIAPVTDEVGKVTHFVAMTEDITEAKQIALALQEAQERNELILNSAGEGIFGLNFDGKVTFVNPTAAEMLGYDVEELVGESMHALVHHSYPDGQHYPREECYMYKTAHDGISHVIDNEVLWHKDGHGIAVEYTSVPMHKEGKSIGTVVMFKDITDRKLHEERLRASEEQFRTLMESTPDPLIIVDDHAVITMVNRKAEEVFEYSRDEMIGQGVELLVPERFRGGHVAKRDAFLKNPHGHPMSALSGRAIYAQSKSGREFPIEASLSPIKTDQGVMVVTSLRDITERTKAEEDLKDKYDELERFRHMATGRELKMIELKKEINSYLQDQGKEAKYKIVEK